MKEDIIFLYLPEDKMLLLTSIKRQWKLGLVLVLGTPVLCLVTGWVDGAHKFLELSIAALIAWVGGSALEEYKWKVNFTGANEIRRREILQSTDEALFGIFRSYEAANNSVAMLWAGETEEQWTEKANECWKNAKDSLDKARAELWKIRHHFPNYKEIDDHLRGACMAVTGCIQVHQRSHFGDPKRFDHDQYERMETQYKKNMDVLNDFFKVELGPTPRR